jgi:flagellar protein FliL
MAEIEKKTEEASEEGLQENLEGGATEGSSTEEGAEGEAAPKPSKKKKILIALVLVLAIAGGVTGFMIKKQKDKKAAEAAEAESKDATPKAIFHDMDEMIVNLNTEGKNVSFMKIKIILEISKKDDLDAVQKMMPKITDVFQMYMRELRPSDMQGSVGLYRLKEELLLRINKIVHPAQVNDILFKEVLIQ